MRFFSSVIILSRVAHLADPAAITNVWRGFKIVTNKRVIMEAQVLAPTLTTVFTIPIATFGT